MIDIFFLNKKKTIERKKTYLVILIALPYTDFTSNIIGKLIYTISKTRLNLIRSHIDSFLLRFFYFGENNLAE